MSNLLPGHGGALGHHATLPRGWGGHHPSPGPVRGVALPFLHALVPQAGPALGSRSGILPDLPATPRGPLPPAWGPHHICPGPGWGAALFNTPVPVGGCRMRQAVGPHRRRPSISLVIELKHLFQKSFLNNSQHFSQ